MSEILRFAESRFLETDFFLLVSNKILNKKAESHFKGKVRVYTQNTYKEKFSYFPNYFILF